MNLTALIARITEPPERRPGSKILTGLLAGVLLALAPPAASPAATGPAADPETPGGAATDAGVTVTGVPQDPASELAETRARQEMLLELVQRQQARIERLEAMLDQLVAPAGADTAAEDAAARGELDVRPAVIREEMSAAPALASASPRPAPAPAFQGSQAGSGPASENAVRWTELVSGDSKLQLYGFLRLDFQYTDSRANNSETIGFIRSEDPAAPDSIGAPEGAETLTIHPRLTRLGLDYAGPKLGGGDGPKLTGKLEIDFYNSGLVGQAESREAIRLRKAFLQLDWHRVMLLAGQTSDLISPLYPAVNADLVMWGAGNLGDRRAQLRMDLHDSIGKGGRWAFQSAIGLTGAIDSADFDPAGTFGAGVRDGESSGRPTVQSRLAYDRKNAAGGKLGLGLWAHRAWVEPDAQVAGRDEFDSYAYGLDLAVPLYRDKVWLKGEWWRGANLTDVRGGIFQGVNTLTGEEIHAEGGWLELSVQASDRWTTHFGFTTDDPEDADLNVGGRSLNEIYYWSNRFRLGAVQVGLEYLNWTTEYLGFDDGDANRINTYVSYGL